MSANAEATDDDTPRVTFRLSERLDNLTELAAERRGFQTRSEYIRYLLRQDVQQLGGGETITGDPDLDTGGPR